MVRKILYPISLVCCAALLFGCYYGSVTLDDDNWSDIELNDSEGNLEVSVITESGDGLAYQGEELLISWNSGKITEEITIELVDDAKGTTTLVEDYSGTSPWSWLIPEDFPPGESYRIVVTELDSTKSSGVFGYSEEFAILEDFVSGLSDITVSSRSIDITLTDNGSVIDGDTISISLNGAILEANHVLLGPPGTTMTLDLLEGTNSLSILAVNEGSVSPNTAQISFTDVIEGEAVQEWRLNEGETGSLTISAP